MTLVSPSKGLVHIGESDVGMDPAIDDVPIHSGYVRRRLGILDVDEGTNYNYENGAFSQIPLAWDESSKT